MPALKRYDVESRATAASHFWKNIRSLAHNLSPRTKALSSSTSPSTPLLHIRQNGGTVAIPTVYAGINSGPSPGTVVGATLGAVAGFILLVWLFSALSMNRGGRVVDEEVIVRRERGSRRRREMRSVSRSPRRERIIRQERIVRDTSRAPPPRSSFVVEERTERRVDGDDIVEVIEEQSSVAPRKKSKRGTSGYRR